MAYLKRSSQEEVEIFNIPETVLPESELQKYQVTSVSNREDSCYKDRYGDHVETQILKIERALNALSISQLKDVADEARKGLTHFEDFAKRGGTEKPSRIEYLILFAIFVALLMCAFSTFLDIHARALLMGVLAVLVVGIFIELLSKERRQKAISLAIREYPRVRFRVRIAAFLLLITAICFGVKVGQLLKEHQSLTVPISKTSEH